MPHRSELPAAKGGLSGRGHSKGHGHDPRVVNTATALGSAPQEGIYDDRELHRAFLRAYGLDESDFPLLLLDRNDWWEPLSLAWY